MTMRILQDDNNNEMKKHTKKQLQYPLQRIEDLSTTNID